MKIAKTGFILYTINFKDCVKFYRDILGLKVLYEKKDLCCFDFQGSYLMVEVDDTTDLSKPEDNFRDRTCIRLNVENVKVACEVLDQNKIEYSYGEYDWGTIAKFRDPDNNLIGFRSAKEHIEDIAGSSYHPKEIS